MKTDNVQYLCRLHRDAWAAANKWLDPSLVDALDFMVTEAAEAVDARLRMLDGYFRHNEGKTTERDVAVELFDVIFMACTALDILGFDLMEVAQSKLEYGDKKRGLVIHVHGYKEVQDANEST